MGQKEKFISKVRREILIKTVAHVIPTYSMGILKIPKTLCDTIKSTLEKYQWRQIKAEKKIHWINWKKLCTPKGRGGMDFRDVQAFNCAMLAKQAWRLIHNTHSLFYRIYKSMYFPNCSFMNADWATTLPICGEVYWQLEISLEKVHNGRWGMAAILKCLPIASYHTNQYF